MESIHPSLDSPINSHKFVLWAIPIVGLLCLLYWDITNALVMDWYNDPDYSHGFLVPFLSLFFVWERWDDIKQTEIQPSVWGIGLLGLGLLMLLIGDVGAELYTQRCSLIAVLAGLVLLIFGWNIMWLVSLPLAFLVFMVPLPAIVVNTIAFPLQLFAAKTATFCLFSLGIPVLREGNLIALAGTTLEVAEACSGLRSLLSLLALGTVYGYFSQRLLWKRWALVFLSIPIAIVANAIRVSGTGILAHYWGVEAAEGFYHTFEGWIVFVAAFAMLLVCGTLLSWIGRERLQSAES
ncbi:MAG: exosortase/archaeosortase family protein [Nitrospirales bacterium]|nr:exosortase/archaeosortase family protein [Nitrospira sp.]MDR4501942.1 exosortase/archaeosortase family protein [Nitrospirales bacterium]